MNSTISKSRINMRISKSALDEIDEAAGIQGVDRTSFMIDAAATKARNVLLQEKLLVLTDTEVEQLKVALRTDADPNEALVQASNRLTELGI